MQETTEQTKCELHRQGEQLDRISKKFDDLDKQTDKTMKYSRQIYSFWYYLKDKVTGKYKANDNGQQTNI